jgi:hypothetical protein
MPSQRLRPDDLLVEFRDKNLERQGSIPIKDLKLKFQPVYNGVGSWLVTLPAEHRAVPYLRTPGAGIIITNLVTGKVLMSGSTSKPTKKATISDPKGMTTIAGLDDNRLAFDARAFPKPAEADPALQAPNSHDVRSGTGEAIMRQYLAYNIANGALAVGGPVTWAPAGRLGGLRNFLRLEQTNKGLGTVTTQRARFDNLGDLLNKISAESGGLGWRIVQVGSVLEFQVYQPTDRSAFIRLDVVNGTLQETNVEFAPPELTRSIVAGQGDLEERQFIQVTTVASTQAETDWGLIIEDFKDQRQTNVTTELQAAGTGDLNERGFTKVAVKAVPSNDQTMIFLTDFFLGDKVSVVIEGQEQPNSNITEAAIVVDEGGMKTAVAIGDINDFDSDSALRQTVTDNTRRIDAIERNIEIPTVPIGTTKIAMLDAQYTGSGPAKVYWLPSMVLSTDTYEWETPFVVHGNRSVTMVWRGDKWKILGHSGDSMNGARMPLNANFQSYGTFTGSDQYTEFRYCRLSSGIVQLSGLSQVRTWTTLDVIATLPVGYRPDKTLLFQVNVGDNPRIVEVNADGRIRSYGTWPASYVSLDGIAYPAAGVATWTDIGAAGSGSAYQNGFASHPSTAEYGVPGFWKDPYGVVWFRGLIRPGSNVTTDNLVMFTLPASHQSPTQSHVAVGASNGSADQFGMVSAMKLGGVAFKVGSLAAANNGYISLARLTIITAEAKASALNWLGPSNLKNNWVNYDVNAYSPFFLMRRADGLAMSEGLIRSGTLNTELFRLPQSMRGQRTALMAIARNNAIFGRMDNYGFQNPPEANGPGAFWGHTVDQGWTSLDGLKWMVGE